MPCRGAAPTCAPCLPATSTLQLPYSSVLVVAQAHSLQTQVSVAAPSSRLQDGGSGAVRFASLLRRGEPVPAGLWHFQAKRRGVRGASRPACLLPGTARQLRRLTCSPASTPLQVFDATDVVVKSGGHSRVEQGSGAAVS